MSAKAATSVCLADQAKNLFILGKGFRQFHHAQENECFSCSLIPEIMGSNRYPPWSIYTTIYHGCNMSAKAATSVCLADQATNLFILGKGFRKFHDAQEDVYFLCSLIPKIMGING